MHGYHGCSVYAVCMCMCLWVNKCMCTKHKEFVFICICLEALKVFFLKFESNQSDVLTVGQVLYYDYVII